MKQYYRCYDVDVRHFTSRDPIGLLGGFNVYAYVSDSTMWYDRLVLSNSCGGKVTKKGLHRPYIRKHVRETVESRAKTSDGRIRDANTGKSLLTDNMIWVTSAVMKSEEKKLKLTRMG